MSLPAWTRRPDSPPVSQSTPVAGILLWITVNWGELGQTGWLGTGRGNGDNPKDKHNISPDTWKKGCPDSPRLAQFTPTVPNHPHGQYIRPRLFPRPCPRPRPHLNWIHVLVLSSSSVVKNVDFHGFWPLTFDLREPASKRRRSLKNTVENVPGRKMITSRYALLDKTTRSILRDGGTT